MRPEERERAERLEPRRRLLWLLWWTVLPILVVVLMAAAVEIPVLFVLPAALLVAAWVKRDRWNWPRDQRYTTIAIVTVVLVAFLFQRLVD